MNADDDEDDDDDDDDNDNDNEDNDDEEDEDEEELSKLFSKLAFHVLFYLYIRYANLARIFATFYNLR